MRRPYTSIFLQAVLSQWDLATIYPWFSLVTVVTTLVAAGAVIGALCPRDTSRLGLAVAATTATVVFIGGLPSATEAFFWMTSAITYQWAIIVYLAAQQAREAILRASHNRGRAL